MSRLDELIAELCPDGVEYKPLGSLITRVREKGKDDTNIKQVYVVSNTFGIVRTEDYHDEAIHSEDTSNYTIIRTGMFAYNPSRLNVGSLGLLTNEIDGLVSPMYVVFSVNSELDTHYLQYFLQSSYAKNRINSLKEEGARFRFEFSRWNKLKIPVPPLEVQHEIVKILDHFIKFKTELTAELTARQKQYEFYRDTLLTFDVHGGGTSKVQWKTLGEIAKIKNGKTYKNICSGEIPVYGSGGIMTYIGEYCYNKPSVLIPRKGSLSNLFYVDTPFWNVDTIFYTEIDEQQVVPKYLFYLLKKEHIERLNTAGGVPSLTQTVLNNISLAIPSITVQKRIVNVLDNFEKICNDLNIGLPAEIEARQKQYEYYRDKLLTFKEK